MIKSYPLLAAVVLMPALCLAPALRAQTTPAPDAAPVGGIAPTPLFDTTDKNAATRFTAANGSDSQVSVVASDGGTGVDVTIQPGDSGYPGVVLKPQGAAVWSFSPYGDMKATIKNTSAKKAGFGLRVDNEGDPKTSPWNTELVWFNPGETKIIKVIFGYSSGKKGYALKSNAVSQVMVFEAGKVAGAPLTFHIESIEASGSVGEKPPVDPSTVRLAPPDGYLLGPGATIDAAKQLVGKGGATGSVVDSPSGPSLKLDFPVGTGEESVTLKPPMGKWDLREFLEIRVKVRNDGQAPVTPSAVAVSDNVQTETIAAAAPIAPGAEAEIVVPFANSKIFSSTNQTIVKLYVDVRDPGTGNKFLNNAGTGVIVSVSGSDAAQSLTVESIKADLPPYSVPDWLGQKPPEDGDWVKTFDDEFDGPAIDETKWNLTTPYFFWDGAAHPSKDETTLVDGKAVIRFEKKPGFNIDDPKQKVTPYACGYLDTYGKWVQRYGYFESRFKLPKQPGLWPCFWLVPDRGPAAGHEFWQRQSTAIDPVTHTKGMEIDICEYLSGWGPNRYNIAMHWDGYDKYHKASGQTTNYAQPDKDGYLTCGVLWVPGKLQFYANGKEIFHFENARVPDAPDFIIYNFVHGGWDNLPLDDAQLPADYVIDYVRVWQRKDLASDADGYKTASGAATPAATGQ